MESFIQAPRTRHHSRQSSPAADHMQLEITVVPKSRAFRIEKKDGKIKIHLRSAPESNKANLELIRELKKLLKADVRIVAGLSSRRKILEIALDEEQLKNMLPI